MRSLTYVRDDTYPNNKSLFMSFLTAEWKNLILINYKIDPNILTPYIPKGTELDFYNGSCYVSLVGFLFHNTKLLGMKIPFHHTFEEINLRFYVKYKDGNVWKRGVVFIKELVPKPTLTFVANTIYKENYQTVPIQHKWTSNELENIVEYQWSVKNRTQKICVHCELNLKEIESDSEAEFITEHYFGYTKQHNNTYEYEVKHPKWKHYPVQDYNIDVDFELNYGKNFKYLNLILPNSILLADGSEVSVENKKRV